MRTHGGRRNAGFTLVELLIAMGIIVTLMGLLMPTIHRARLAGMRTTCRGNIGSIAKACITYAMLSRSGALPNTAPTESNWSDIEVGNAAGLWLLTENLLSPGAFFCPEARMRRGYLQAGADDGAFFYSDGVGSLSYSYISLVGKYKYMPEGSKVEVETPFRDLTTLDATGLTTQLGFSSSLIIVGDQNPRTTFKDNLIDDNASECSPNHHGVGQNVGAMDQTARWMQGTVETEMEDDIYAAEDAAVSSQSPVRGKLGETYLLP